MQAVQRILLGGAASILDFILYENSHNMVIEDLVGVSLISEVWVVIAVIVDILPGHSTNYSGDIFSCTAKSQLTPAGKLINFCSI